MYNDYFGFKEAPFSIAPDPHYLYMTAQHRDALAHLVYGINSEGGCILLTGEVGTGKTTICRCLLEQIPEQSNVALVLNPKVSEIELLETICDELHISYPQSDDPAFKNSVKTYTDRIYEFLINSNRNNEKTVLIIDEAQNLDSKVLEQLRLLTNLETDQRKLLQIIILGQPELLDILARTEMRQLAQRITARFHLQPLTKYEVKAYVSHRLAVAGQNIQLFPEASIKLLYKLSHGVPRLINIICDRSLLGCYVENQYTVQPFILKKAAKEVFGELKNIDNKSKIKIGLSSALAISSLILLFSGLLGAGIMFYINQKSDDDKSDIAKTASITNQAEATDVQNTDSVPALPAEDVENKEIPSSSILTNATSPDQTSKQTSYDSIDDILDNVSGNKITAYEQLFDVWDQQYNKNTNNTACKQAESFSLSCLHKQGNLNSLKTHNRPAVLKLINDQGNFRYVTITSIDNDLATVYADKTAYTFKLSDLDQHWYGQFILLWKKPEAYTSPIMPGDRGQIISWLNARLADADTPSENTFSIYNKTMIEKVKKFQARHGLTADGIVGPLTIIYFNAQAGANIPTLTKQI